MTNPDLVERVADAAVRASQEWVDNVGDARTRAATHWEYVAQATIDAYEEWQREQIARIAPISDKDRKSVECFESITRGLAAAYGLPAPPKESE